MSALNAGRAQRLASHYLLDEVAAARLRDTVELAAATVGFPHAQVNVLDDTTQYTISDYRAGGSTAIPRERSMCNFTVTSDGVLAVEDLRIDARWRNLPGVLDGRAASYLGVALRGRESAPVGTLCFFDSSPRVITDEQIEQITQFGVIIEDQLDLIRRIREQPTLNRTRSADLIRAIERSEIVPWFQPIIDLSTDRIVAYEALAQWERVDGQVENLSRFDPLAEDTDIVIDLRLMIMRKALIEFASWRRPDLRLNLNLPTQQLGIPDAITAVHNGVLSCGVDPRLVDLEIAETPGVGEQNLTKEAVRRLHDYGYRVLLDGYGTGWSSLEWVLGLPIDGVKLDRTITSALGTPAGDAITRALVNLTSELQLDTIIEGIETPVQAGLARGLGYRYAQGGQATTSPFNTSARTRDL